ncbi:similar to RIKEN cDNA A530088I07 gene, isoform CRA_b [Rattus norvegicus]|uniref:Gamma-secretase activating protein n=2 Tax=Rattus norvegicus TaxID=10116 RepID=A0A0G2JWZ3_RAT|nr:gamma-secretase-activating protein precursor [Rattus norvegicus]EDL99432.1 similar to RIKEN cDNA A530088I07 gene, isoform CRA_b [Rattus norvegicus]|eukprot:XP_006235997.1 PREDICTED: gamma-secretase-activating protein isoform X1 [Rattus norvegicus]
MALRLVTHFDVLADVLPSLLVQAATADEGDEGAETTLGSLRVLNIERNGDIIYTYKDNKGNAVFGIFDCQTRENEHLYTFEKDMQAVSCSVNSERTVLAASFIQYTEGVRSELQPGSKCLTLLVEIHPVNNVTVLKAVDSCVWVQFLYPQAESHLLAQNHLLLISEEKYIERFHIQITREDGNRVVIRNSSHLPRERIAEDFVWAQWDVSEQRIHYIELQESRSILKCVQFWADESFTIMFEMPLDISLSGLRFKLVNFGYDYRQDQAKLCHQPSLCIFTNHTGSLCVCYSPKSDSWKEITYSVFYLHKGYRKTFTVAPGSTDSQVANGVTFLNLGYFVAVYSPCRFLHLLNIRHPDLICHSLFLTGNNKTAAVLPPSPLQSLPGSLILDCSSGKVYRATLDQSYLMGFLWNAQLDCEKMAALHCALSCDSDPGFPEQIVQWVSERVSACHSFDLIQEFLIASSYWSVYPGLDDVDLLLPYSSVLTWDTEIPGMKLVTEELPLPLMKVYSLKGYWAKLNSNLEYIKYTKPHLHYHNSVVRREWHNLISEERTGKRRSTMYVRNILDNAVKVISNMEMKTFEPRLIPLLQEEDRHQRLLMGLMVSELRDHLLRHLQGVEKKKIEQMVLDYISKLLDLVWCLLETSWRKHSVHPWVLHLNEHGSPADFEVFHLMTRILDAASSLCFPLPPGFHSLHTILGVHCLPLYNLLHYIDNGVLLLTETVVTRLMKDLDNSEKNEKLKFSIIVRLPPLIGQKVCRLWDHPMSSNIISRNHVAQLLKNYKKEPQSSMIDKSSFPVEFLPLNYFIEILMHLESSNQALHGFEGHDNVDAEFVEEAALKHTTSLLGL